MENSSLVKSVVNSVLVAGLSKGDGSKIAQTRVLP